MPASVSPPNPSTPNADRPQKSDQSPFELIKPLNLGVLAIIAAGLISRPAATAIGPILLELKTGLGMSASMAGVLTALPGFCFAIIGLLAGKLPARFGLLGSLIQGAALIVLGMTLRALTGSWQFFLVLTFIALAGMAIGNVLVPVFIKTAFPGKTAQMTTIFTTFLAVGQTLPTLLSNPLEQSGSAWLGTSHGWRIAIGTWSVFAVLSLFSWIAVRRRCTFFDPTRRNQVALDSTPKSVPLRSLWRSPTAVGLMVFFGLQSMHAYLQFGWLPQIYRDGGLDPTLASLMVTIITFGGIVAGMLMPRIISRRKYLPAWMFVFSALSALGYIGIAFAPTTLPWLWAIALSIAGFAFASSLALIIERTESPAVTSAVSGFVQPVGYFLAALGPLFVGVAYEATGNWRPILLTLAASSVLLFVSGLLAVRPRTIDNEIRHIARRSDSHLSPGE